ncbi:MAG: hypothetical protein L0Y66_15690 [Myxococcaceae bacterium]|nr:hypothetical protein [Myxococcaceae bacterium]MCI0671940.1 hypothetical protein [Myxococcaceae bacterium]
MNVLVVYARLYAECLRNALDGIRRNAWTLLLPMVLLFVWELSIRLIGSMQLGLIGGILAGLGRAALVSCYLYFVGEVVAQSKVRPAEFSRSFGAYFWAIINVYFVLWVVELVLGMLPNAGLLLTALWLVSLVALNALPETLYQRGSYGGLATIQESFRFLQDNWVEWLVPNALLVGALYAVLSFGPRLGVPWWGAYVVAGALLHVAMVFRGHLFRALVSSSHRQRMFRHRELGR